MRNRLFLWAVKYGKWIFPESIKTHIAYWLLTVVFPLRYKLQRAEDEIAFLQRETKRYHKKMDRLYMICAEYEALGESCTHEETKTREAVAYDD